MGKEASRLIEWEGTDGAIRSLVQVIDHDKDEDDIDHCWLEICVREGEEGEIKTEERIGYVDEIKGVSFPETLVD